MGKYKIIILALVASAAFFLRLGSYEREVPLSYDEVVYSVLGAQLAQDPFHYNTRVLYEQGRREGRELPEYFDHPLFKHPPLFAYLVALNHSLSGQKYYSAFQVSLFFGVMLIPLGFLLGRLLFGNKVGMYSALLMSIEPISLICSQKIWMETTLAFLMILSLYLFACSIKRYDPYRMIAGGLVAGLATLTKYPGILCIFPIIGYALLRERHLFRKRSFLVSLSLPVLMLIPWLIWNYRVYGPGLLTSFLGDPDTGRFLRNLRQFGALYLLAIAVPCILVLARRKTAYYWELFLTWRKGTLWKGAVLLILAGVLFVFRGNIINTFTLDHMPKAGWRMGMFAEKTWGFYPWQALELSPFYLFSYLSLVVLVLSRKDRTGILYLLAFIIPTLAFWIAWGQYQSRYITSLTVPLMILSARSQLFIFAQTDKISSKKARLTVKAFLALLVLFALIRTLIVNIALAVPNIIIYF